MFLEDLDEAGEGGAVMVSAVVRAPPTDIFRQIVHVRKREAPTGVFTGARTVEVVDGRTAVSPLQGCGRRVAQGPGRRLGWAVRVPPS